MLEREDLARLDDKLGVLTAHPGGPVDALAFATEFARLNNIADVELVREAVHVRGAKLGLNIVDNRPT